MIDLHVHLAGSLKPATIIEYAKERNVPLPTYNASELESYLEAPDHCTDTAEFYELCDMTDWVLQERRSIRRAMTEMVRSWMPRVSCMRKFVFHHPNVRWEACVRGMQCRQRWKD